MTWSLQRSHMRRPLTGFLIIIFFLPTSWTIGIMSRLKTFKYHENVYMPRVRLANKIFLTCRNKYRDKRKES